MLDKTSKKYKNLENSIKLIDFLTKLSNEVVLDSEMKESIPFLKDLFIHQLGLEEIASQVQYEIKKRDYIIKKVIFT